MRIFKRIFGKPKNQTVSINYRPNFESITDPRQISSIFEWIFNPDSKIAEDCSKTIHRLLISKSSFKNKSLYFSLKNIHLKKEDLVRFGKFETEIQNSLYSIASMNSDGYVREEALIFLIKNPTQRTFPFILFRLADWVPTIKQISEHGIRKLIQEYKPEFLIRYHKIIDWLLKVERSDLEGIHQEITEFIFSEQNIQQIIANLEDYEEGDRYFIFRNLIARNLLDEQIFEKILMDKNFLIRLLAIRNIDMLERPDVLKKLLNDRSQKIRHHAINKISETQIEQFQTELNSYIHLLGHYA